MKILPGMAVPVQQQSVFAPLISGTVALLAVWVVLTLDLLKG